MRAVALRTMMMASVTAFTAPTVRAMASPAVCPFFKFIARMLARLAANMIALKILKAFLPNVISLLNFIFAASETLSSMLVRFPPVKVPSIFPSARTRLKTAATCLSSNSFLLV